MHTVKYWDSKLYQLQKLADSINYHIDSDADYLQICKLLPESRSKPAPPGNFTTFLQCGRAGTECKKM